LCLLVFQQKYTEETGGEEPDSDIHLFLPANPKGQSRIQNEFEVLKWLGKGAFGDVLKVIMLFSVLHLMTNCWNGSPKPFFSTVWMY
jgi:hypothetical protein